MKTLGRLPRRGEAVTLAGLEAARRARRSAPHRHAAGDLPRDLPPPRPSRPTDAVAKIVTLNSIPLLADRRVRLALAAAAGAALCAAFAPSNLWLLALLSPALLMSLWQGATAPACRGPGVLVQRRHVRQRAPTGCTSAFIRSAQAPAWMALIAMAGLVVHPGAVRRRARAGWWPAGCRRPVRCAGWPPCRPHGCWRNGSAAGSSPAFRGCRWAIRRPAPGWRVSPRYSVSMACRRCCWWARARS